MSETVQTQLTHPVIEMFGSTIQGEGVLIGTPVHFVRFGGCDYRCEWCDSMFAVLPDEVKKNSTPMTDDEIIDGLAALEGEPRWVVLSGGNPALQKLDGLLDKLHKAGYKVTIETQGTVFRDWIRKVDKVTVSPKPPSSGNVTTMEQVEKFEYKLRERLDTSDPNIPSLILGPKPGQLSYKVVVFNDDDLEYLRELVRFTEGRFEIFLSIGTDVGKDSREDLCEKWRYWAEYVMKDPELANVRVLPQAHVLLWGHGRGF